MILFLSVAQEGVLLVSGGFVAHEWSWIWPKACVATGTPWPSGAFPAAAVLQLFLHLQRAPISCHGLVSSHRGSRRWLPFILDFRGSQGHSMRCRFRHLISFPSDLQEKMFINTWHLMSLPCARSCMHLCKRAPWSLVRRQQRLFWQHSYSWWFLQMETFHSEVIHAQGDISEHNQCDWWMLLEPPVNHRSLNDNKWVT